MPTYDYRCPSCKATSTRKVPIAERDKQTCDTKVIVKATVNGYSLTAGGIAPTGTIEETKSCGHTLEREEIPLTAHTPYGWKP